MKWATLALAGLLTASCAHTGSSHHGSPSGETVTLSLQDIACQSCGAASVRALEKREGVMEASFNRDAAEVTVRYDPTRIRPELLVKSVAELGYAAEVGAGKGRYLPDVEFPPELDVQWISRDGSTVELERHVERGKVTVFDFYATWCGPCREVDREMLSILKESSDVALRKLNVVDWESGVAKKYLQNVANLPFVIVYDKSGQRLAEISGLDLDRLRAVVEEGRGG